MTFGAPGIRWPIIAGALILQLLLLVYHQVTTRFDFFPFNGARYYSARERQLEAGSNLVLMGLPPAGFMLHVPVLMKFGVVYYFVLFAVECTTWWGPYFFGAAPKWAATHAKLHAQTIALLPQRAGHPTPNLEHLILMALTLLAAVATLVHYREAGGTLFPFRWITFAASAVLAGGTFYQFVLSGRTKIKATAPR